MEKAEEEARKTQLGNVAPVAELVLSGIEQEQDEEEREKQQQEMEFISTCSHQKLTQKIYRLRTQINSPISLKLPDKGEKLRRSLKLLEDEQERRNQLQRQKEAEATTTIHQVIHELVQEADCEKSTQSRSSCSHGECDGLISKPPAAQTPLPSEAALFRNGVEDKAAECENSKLSQSSCSPGACNDFSSEALSSQALSRSRSTFQQQGDTEPPYVGNGNHQHPESNGPPKNNRRGTNNWWHKSPFQGSKFSNRNGNENRPPFGPQNDIGSSRSRPPRQNGRFCNRSFNRPRRPEMTLPSLQSLLQSIITSSSSTGTQSQAPPVTYQVNTGGPSEAQMAEMLSLIQVMQQQWQTVQSRLESIESKLTKLSK